MFTQDRQNMFKPSMKHGKLLAERIGKLINVVNKPKYSHHNAAAQQRKEIERTQEEKHEQNENH
jgi:hypothetical protein